MIAGLREAEEVLINFPHPLASPLSQLLELTNASRYLQNFSVEHPSYLLIPILLVLNPSIVGIAAVP